MKKEKRASARERKALSVSCADSSPGGRAKALSVSCADSSPGGRVKGCGVTKREERRLEWTVALCALCTAVVCVAGAALFVASVFFGWGAAA